MPRKKQKSGGRKTKEADIKKIPSFITLLKKTIAQLLQQKRFFALATLIYGALTLGLVSNFVNTGNIDVLKESLQTTGGPLSNSVTIFGLLLGGNQTADASANAYQSLLLLIFSLVFIWGLRQSQATSGKLSVKAAFYKGMTPLVPFLLVAFVIALQLVPASIGGALYTSAIQSGAAVTIAEQAIFVLLMVLLLLASLVMLISSIFAIYIVTLPDMTPMRALRSARKLVRYNRWDIARKLLLFSITLLLAVGLVIIPLIMFVPFLAEWIFFACSIIVLPIVHSYLYSLYKEML